MLFNSFPFLLGFLPVALGLHAIVALHRPGWRLPLLVGLSLVFYGWWDPRFVPLLAASIGLNWLVARWFGRSRVGLLIPLAIAVNLAVLALFKYAGFLAGLAALLPGLHDLGRPSLALPLGISFFTFHHIMYLSDLRAGRAPLVGPVRFGLYISFFPQVLAGPLVRWSEILHQFDEKPYARPDAAERIGRGLMLLCLGLAKKVFLGDPLAAYANPVFQAAAEGKVISLVEAWQGTLAFTFQIYFDFSGYTDMALGLALLFGIVLPENFRAPYRAVSIQDFWRRWHITLSSFLRDYLYIPFGGSRHGLARQLLALLATMALGGLWHGAGLTFVAWGAAHGIALGLHVLWRRAGLSMPEIAGLFATLTFVCLAWVPFRAPDFATALAVYRGLLGLGTDAADASAGFWPLAAGAACLAILGPTAREAVERLVPRPWAAAATALVLAAILLQVGNDANQAFIYARF